MYLALGREDEQKMSGYQVIEPRSRGTEPERVRWKAKVVLYIS